MLRILTVTLNPAWDEIYTVSGFAPGVLNRAISSTSSAGGKGINVARAYRALGGDAVAAGFVGGRVGARILQSLNAEGIPTAFVGIAGESRTCIKISDRKDGSLTELNSAGPAVSAEEYSALVASLRELIPGFDAVVLTGTVPEAVRDTVYADLIRIAQDDLGVPAVLDASGVHLRLGIAAHPEVAKPNLDEAGFLGVAPNRWQDAASELRSRFNVPTAIVTAGPRGAVIATEAGVWEAKPPSIAVGSTVGSGDSLTAGLLSLWGSVDPVEALRFGVAAGTVNATGYHPGELSSDAVAEMTARVVVSRIR